MLKIEIYGQSRSEKIGIKISNFPKGFRINLLELQKFVDRRKSQDNIWSTPRKEADGIELVSGAFMVSDAEFETNGDILEFSITNIDIKSDNLSAKEAPYLCRPSHADFVSYKKYGQIFPGGGPFSGRMMAPFAILGGIASQVLSKNSINVAAYITQIGKEKAKSYYDNKKVFNFIDDSFRVLDENDKQRLVSEIEKAAEKKDSVGGKIECVAFGVPAGLGGAIYDSFEGRLAYHLFAIPAIKSYECGIGANFASSNASKVNDQFCKTNGKVLTKTNYNGGVVGGITNGEPIVFSVSVKPVPSIGLEQDFYNIKTDEIEKFALKGRNDACIVPRAVVLVESALAITILEYMIDSKLI
ncbi:MAG: chorismate synthase [Clostridiales bacterium]|jgi:chorismate synthase|nr:chorismate synthase [Clostridiales bacterium]